MPARFAQELPDRDTPILLHCHSGARSGRAAAYLAQQGYTNLVNMAGLIDDWPRLGGAWEAPDAAAHPVAAAPLLAARR